MAAFTCLSGAESLIRKDSPGPAIRRMAGSDVGSEWHIFGPRDLDPELCGNKAKVRVCKCGPLGKSIKTLCVYRHVVPEDMLYLRTCST